MNDTILKIHEEFKNLIPPLTKAEYSELTLSIRNEGIRDAICLWNGYIADGHNRYAIAQEYDLPFETREMDFEDELACKFWIIKNQLARRNINDWVRFDLVMRKANIWKEIGRENLKTNVGGDHMGLPTIGKGTEPHNTQKEIAKDLGWSHSKVAMADVVSKKADEETVDYG